MISLNSYQSIEDAWQGGVADWCRAASAFALRGGRAWLVAASDGQANEFKRRLLHEGVSLAGVRFLDARALRRELCLLRGWPAPALDQNALEFLLRLHALAAPRPGPEWSAVARHPGACLAALDDFAAAHWLDERGLLDDALPPGLGEWLPALQATGAWPPAVDRRLAEAPPLASAGLPVSLCAVGWDANRWPQFDLFAAAVRTAGSAYVFLPLPRGSGTLEGSWHEACERAFGVEIMPCESSGFEAAQGTLAGRIEGADLADDDERPASPELLVGADRADTLALVRDFAARWLLGRAADGGESTDRLALLCPGRGPTSVALVRALAAAGIAAEDELGELPEPAREVQIQRAILDYHQNQAGLEPMLTLVELLNGHAAALGHAGAGLLAGAFPLDPTEVRRALHGAFAEVQHHSARVLARTAALGRAPVARALRRLVAHLDEWPERLAWPDARRRWARCLEGLGLTTRTLEPLWSDVADLPAPATLPASAFFQYLSAVLHGTAARRVAGAPNRFARVVVTTLEGAGGQAWGGALLLDSTEGQWPLYPPENPFLDDSIRARLNARRAPDGSGEEMDPQRGHLLTSADRAQLEHFRFVELLENCDGPLAFAAAARDPADPNKELYPNEWALRCLVESRWSPEEGETLLERWRRAVRRVRPAPGKLGAAERRHLTGTFTRRRDPEAPFDDYFLNFAPLTAPDELPWAEAWSAGELDAAWNRPATFALAQIFAAQPWRNTADALARGEGWMVGRSVHRWVGEALGAAREPRRMTPGDWAHALTDGLARVRAQAEERLLASLARGVPAAGAGPAAALPLWWRGVLRKAEWAARRCLEELRQTAAKAPSGELWLCLDRSFDAELSTPAGPLRLRARCDVALLDQPTLPGASCRLLDLRTGAAPAAAPSAAQMAQGRGLHLGAALLLAVAEGARPDLSASGVIHPDSSHPALFHGDDAPALAPALGQLARQQRALVFGQRGAIVAGPGRDGGENLPLATTPVDPGVLAQKAAATPF